MIIIQYDGCFPNLCSWTLIVTVDEIEWVFPEYCLRSDGSVYFTNNYENEHVEKGELPKVKTLGFLFHRPLS